MRFVVYGAGAVGGVIGGHLSLAGLSVSLVARGDHLEAIREGGLLLDTATGMHRILAPAAGSAAGLAWTPDSVVVLAVKSHQAATALADLSRHAPHETPIVCATNGVATEVAALRQFPRVYGVCVMLPATHLQPGEVVAKCAPTPGILDIGRFPSGTDDLTAAVASDLRAAGFLCEERPDIMAWKRRKLLANIVGDAGALFGRGDDGRELGRRVAAEGEAVLAASGVDVVDEATDDVRRGDVLVMRPDIDSAGVNSLVQSLSRGLDSEIDFRAGKIVLLGRLHGVPTPANEAIVAATHRVAAGERQISRLDASEVLDELDSPNRG